MWHDEPRTRHLLDLLYPRGIDEEAGIVPSGLHSGDGLSELVLEMDVVFTRKVFLGQPEQSSENHAVKHDHVQAAQLPGNPSSASNRETVSLFAVKR